jgi:hypothetical protein
MEIIIETPSYDDLTDQEFVEIADAVAGSLESRGLFVGSVAITPNRFAAYDSEACTSFRIGRDTDAGVVAADAGSNTEVE